MTNTETKVGSDPKHTEHCRNIVKREVRVLKAHLGAAAGMFSHDTRESLLMAQICGIIAQQDNEEAPLWRTQELIVVARQMFNQED